MSIDDSLVDLNKIKESQSLDKNVGKRKKYLTDYFTRVPKKKMESKAVPVILGQSMSDNELSEDLPRDTYWKIVAEKKRKQLKKALDENKRLHKLKKLLLKKKLRYKKKLKNTNKLVEVIKAVWHIAADDTGIADLNKPNVE